MEKLSSDRNLVRDRPHPFVVSRSSFDRRDARRKLLESDVVVVLPCPLRRVSEEVDHASDMPDSLGAYRTPEPSPAALAFSTWVTALADPEGSRPRAKAPSYYNKGYTGFRRNAGFRMFSDSQEWFGPVLADTPRLFDEKPPLRLRV
jgi:hypothetical protein